MAEEQARHRQALEKRDMEIAASQQEAILSIARQNNEKEHEAHKRGQRFAITIAAFGMIVSAVLAIALGGWPGALSGTCISGGTIASLVYAFLRGQKQSAEATVGDVKNESTGVDP